MLWAIIAVGRHEDQREEQRLAAIYRQIHQNNLDRLARLAELRTIDSMVALEAFRVKEGLSSIHDTPRP
ncbi:hypothetical protein AWC19_14250 [Mycobacterium palustre]|uniref:Uncharacterized protein n=2 Tax=Mycobacterium palustre TaxID=153971 RepID=A0A1X1ZCN4_9MYCO|nr:hypothetical protein AWC19_14250 [Mycobacterium palustre]